MKIQSIVCSAALALAATAVMAAPPVDNISHKRHANLAAAQRLTTQAYERIVKAQQANEFDLAGHAAKAKELLDQANRELRQAATTSNENHR